MNEEMIRKIQNAESKEEILAIAKEYGEEWTAEQAEELQKRLSGAADELSDDDLEEVAGGSGRVGPIGPGYEYPPEKFF